MSRFWAILSSPLVVIFYCVAVGHAIAHLAADSALLPETFHEDRGIGFIYVPIGIFIGCCLGVVLHELGHALTARALGASVYRISIGNGPVLAEFDFAGFPRRLHYFPMSGMVYYGLFLKHRARTKMMLITLAGPVVSTILAAAAFASCLLLSNEGGAWQNQDDLLAICVGWCAGALILLPGTLLPFTYKAQGRKMQSDALRLLSRAWMSDHEIDIFVRSSVARQGLVPGILTLQDALARVEKQPHDRAVLNSAIDFLRANSDERALSFALKLLDPPDDSTTDRIHALDTVLTIALDLNNVREVPAADALAAELVELASQDPSARGTQAAVLVDLGRVSEGEPMLRELLTSSNPLILGYSHLFLALLEKERGNWEAARSHAEQSQQAQPLCPALGRVADLLAKPAGIVG